MHFLLSSMSLMYVLTTPIPNDGDDANVDQLRKRAKWDNDDYVFRGLILNDFKHTLKHLKEELTLVKLGSHLRIEESLRVEDSDKPKKKQCCWSTMIGHGCVNLRFSSVNIVFLFNILHVPNIKKDMVSNIKKCMVSNGIFVFVNKLNIVNNIGKSAFMPTFKLNDSIIWAVVRLPDLKPKFLGERGIECIFVGCVEHSKAFRFHAIEPNDLVSIKSILESRDAIFDENIFSSVPIPSLRIPNETEYIGGLVVPKEVTEEVIQQPEPELRKSKRNRTPKDFGLEFQLYLIEETRNEDVAFWKEAINDDMDSIMGNNTCVLADLPPGCKWIFKRKLNVDGTIEKFKASTIRLLIVMASIHNLIIHQMDVKTTFLNGDLDEEHAPKQWHLKFDEVVLSNGYLLNQADKCIYSKFDKSGIFVIKVLYEGHGEADVILCIRIKHESNEIAISQSTYIEKVLKKFNYFDCAPVSTPMDTSELMPNNGQAVSQLVYSKVIGCLMYAMTCTRPDIAFVVGKLSRYTSNPSTQHWQAIKRVLKYLRKTIDYRLTFTCYPSVLEGYTDASWISNTEDNSSTSGWVFLLGGGAISWAFKKQTCFTGSTMKYELWL
nr:hypothetical protein [Tanacetum cinerariifolium]